ncbi:MAG: solute carrier family 26 protein [Crocinitomicaceae bacterium]
MKRYFPILDWLPNYSKKQFKGDLPAGLTVGVILVPQGMAYAMIAGLPPVYGLYAALFPQLVYAILGTSRQLAVGPVALDSLLVASGLGALKLSGITDYISMAIFLAFFMGCIQLFLGLLRMGFLVNFLSKPVISGFTSAAALIIGFSQLKHLMGVSIEGSSHIHEAVVNTFQVIGQTNLYTLGIGIAGILIILLLRKWKRAFPASLFVVLLGIALMYFSNLQESGVQLVGAIPKGLPAFHFTTPSQEQFVAIFPIALALALVAFTEAVSIGKSLEHKHDDYKVDASQELVALGSANIIGSLFQSYPTTGGFSRSAVNHEAGAKTGMAAVIAAIIVAATLLFLTPVFYFLPKAALASIIMVAVLGLMDFKYPIHLLRNHRDEFLLLLITFMVTLFIGIIQGIIVGVLFSLLLLVYRTAKPHIAELSRITGTNYFKNVERFPNEVEHRTDLLIFRFDGQLYFGNTNYFKSELAKRSGKKGAQLRAIILNAESLNYIDSTGGNVLLNVIKEMKKKGVRFMISGAIGPTRDKLFKNGIIDELGEENLFIQTHEAVDFLDKGKANTDMQNKIVRQTKP